MRYIINVVKVSSFRPLVSNNTKTFFVTSNKLERLSKKTFFHYLPVWTGASQVLHSGRLHNY
jgi:hypothetical protein